MSHGPLSFDEEDLGLISRLRDLYELEADRLSGPKASERSLDEVLWTRKEAFAHISTEDPAVLDSLLSKLADEEHLMEVPGEEGAEPRYITRVAETVRVLGHTYEYWERNRSGIEASHWLVEDKSIPERRVPARSAIEEIQTEVSERLADPALVERLQIAVQRAVEAVARSFAPDDGRWEEIEFSPFQVEAAVQMILGQYGGDGAEPDEVLVADVGAGKTGAFLIGTFTSAIEARLCGEERTHLLLYPRTALAQDQAKTVEGVRAELQDGDVRTHLEHYSHYQEQDQSVKGGIEETYGGHEPVPDIIVTTLETLKRRLHNPTFIKNVGPRIQRVVLDEIHLIEGLTGTNVIWLMERLRSASEGTDINFTGSSATIAVPDEHTAEVFGIDPDRTQVISPAEEELIPMGLVHHVFLKPAEDVSTLGTLVNLTSSLVHLRRGRMSDRPGAMDELPKTIGFADNLDLLGRWNADFRENERTEHDRYGRRHPTSPGPDGWQSRERELPYALRFRKPFTRRLNAEPGDPESVQYDPVLESSSTRDPCDRCLSGERTEVARCSPEELRELGRIVYREPTEDNDSIGEFRIDDPAFQADEETTVGTMDLCPFLQAGACHWFNRDEFESEQIPGTGLHEWMDVARSSIHSSKKRREAEASDELEDIVFRSTVEEVYDVDGREGEIPIDIVLASPSLEVGIDLPNVTEEVMHKAIRNVASYRQKAGRAGRETGSDTMIVTLLSNRSTDLHYYRQPRKLVSTGQLDPVPLKAHNDVLRRTALYLGTWDQLALRTDLPEVVPLGQGSDEGETEFTERLRTTLDQMRANRGQLARSLRNFGDPEPPKEVVDEVIEQVERELELLLIPVDEVIEGDQFSTAADLVVNHLSSYGKKVSFKPEVAEKVEDLEDETKILIETRLPNVNPFALGIVGPVREVEAMAKAGWEPDHLNDVLEEIKDQVGERPDDRDLRNFLRALEEIAYLLEDVQDLAPRSGLRPRYFFEQLKSEFPEDAKGQAYYLSYLIQELPIFNRRKINPAYAMPETLFLNPYEPRVELRESFDDGGHRTLEPVPLTEALHSFVPGSWTYRLGRDPKKVRVGPLQAREGGSLIAELDQLRKVGNTLQEVKTDVAGPPWMDESVRVLQPLRLNLKPSGKYQPLARQNQAIADGDELDKDAEPTTRVKVPKTFNQRWLDVRSERSEEITAYDGWTDLLTLEQDDDGMVEGKAVLDRIEHPLMGAHLEAIRWHPELDVIDYVHAVGRVYTGGGSSGTEVQFEDRGRKLGLGYETKTEGVSLELQPELVEDAVQTVLDGARRGENRWFPTVLKGITALLQRVELEDGSSLGPFIARDLVGMYLTTRENRSVDPSPEATVSDLETLLEDPEALKDAARRYARSKRREVSEEIREDTRGEEEAEEAIEEDRLYKQLVDAGSRVASRLDGIEQEFPSWLRFTLLNSFGITALDAVVRLTGTPDENIGYYPDTEAMEDGRYRVFLYDRDEHGNGTTEIVRRFMHILHLQRIIAEAEGAGESYLPSEDFLTILEQELLQCPQAQTDLNALHLDEEGAGVPELQHLQEYSEEVRDIGSDAWGELGVEGPGEAWKLAAIHRAYSAFADSHGLERDEVLRASGICWNGCPECVVQDSLLMGPAAGEDHVDKKLLDEWFRSGADQVDEYDRFTASDVPSGPHPTGLGTFSRLRVDRGGKTFRSVALPFTIGIDLDDEDAGLRSSLLMRTSDTLGLSMFEPPAEGGAAGIGLGVSRLLWYLLLMSSFAAAEGRLEEEDKNIRLVFYDIRDVSFDDSGLSENMRSIVEAMKRRSSPGGIETLSDMLTWLDEQGFNIQVCVDEGRTSQGPVQEFLKTIHASTDGSIELLQKSIRKGSMHAKTLLTPVGALYGSANLTLSGTRINEELVNFAPSGSPDYAQVETGCLDILRGAENWDGYR